MQQILFSGKTVQLECFRIFCSPFNFDLGRRHRDSQLPPPSFSTTSIFTLSLRYEHLPQLPFQTKRVQLKGLQTPLPIQCLLLLSRQLRLRLRNMTKAVSLVQCVNLQKLWSKWRPPSHSSPAHFPHPAAWSWIRGSSFISCVTLR